MGVVLTEQRIERLVRPGQRIGVRHRRRSADSGAADLHQHNRSALPARRIPGRTEFGAVPTAFHVAEADPLPTGRASCWEKVGQNVEIPSGTASSTNKTDKQ